MKSVATEDGIAVFFSPNGRCTEAIVEGIRGARKSVKVLAYRLTSTGIREALVAAYKRGVPVTVILDGAQESGAQSDAGPLASRSLSVWIDRSHTTAHNNVVLVDDSSILTGGFGFTMEAEVANADNLLVIRDKPQLSKAYVTDFLQHLAHSTLYRPALPAPNGRDGGGD